MRISPPSGGGLEYYIQIIAAQDDSALNRLDERQIANALTDRQFVRELFSSVTPRPTE
jgi:hypothetical protein